MALDLRLKQRKSYIKRFKRLQSQISKNIDKGLLQAGFQLLDIIRTKTAKGVDLEMYHLHNIQSYLKQLQREGKPTKSDLFYSGRMLGALTPSVEQ